MHRQVRPAVIVLLAVTAFVVLMGLLTGCPKPVPPAPTPTPPPPEPTVKYAEMLLRKCGTGQFCLNGQPIQFRGAIGCCMDGPGLTWPLVGAGFMDYTIQQGGANFFHGRPGPFLKRDEPDMLTLGGTDGAMLRLQRALVANVGGAYVETGGKADLTQWNEPFWTYLAADVDAAGARSSWYEVDVIDGWRLKGGCTYSAWKATNNIQGEQHCGLTPGDPVQDAYLKKLVSTVGLYGNVVWQISNESDQIQGKNAVLVAWEHWVRDRIRAYEQEVGLGVVHMIGTNSSFDEIESTSWIDYIERHNVPIDGPAYAKPTSDNEANPQIKADYVLWRYCKAQKAGAYYWAWRAELSDAEYVRTLQLIKAGCAGVDTSDCPWAVKPTTNIKCRPFGTHGTCDGRPCPAYDCTPNTGSGPVWPEGDPFRADCELKSTGGLPSFSFPSGSPLRIDHGIHGGWGFAVGGHGSAALQCSIPRPGTGWKGCVDSAGQPFIVTVP